MAESSDLTELIELIELVEQSVNELQEVNVDTSRVCESLSKSLMLMWRDWRIDQAHVVLKLVDAYVDAYEAVVDAYYVDGAQSSKFEAINKIRAAVVDGHSISRDTLLRIDPCDATATFTSLALDLCDTERKQLIAALKDLMDSYSKDRDSLIVVSLLSGESLELERSGAGSEEYVERCKHLDALLCEITDVGMTRLT